MRLLVRSWNVFHGRTVPERRRCRLPEAIELVCSGSPDVVCLQEVPLWALGRLEDWSGRTARWVATKHALAGPASALLQRLDARIARSPVTGQANAILVSRALPITAAGSRILNPGAPSERRACQLLRIRADERELLVANVHLSTARSDALRELAIVEELVAGEERVVVCGDLNLARAGLDGFSPPIAGIDQILVRGLEVGRGPAAWPPARRRVGSRALLSDHAPVETEIIVA